MLVSERVVGTGYKLAAVKLAKSASETWEAIKEASRTMRVEHGEWPTHVAVPREIADWLLDFLDRRAELAVLGGITAQTGTVFIGYNESEEPVLDMPDYMRVEIVVQEVSTIPVTDEVLDNLDEIAEKVAAGATAEEARDEVLEEVAALDDEVGSGVWTINEGEPDEEVFTDFGAFMARCRELVGS